MKPRSNKTILKFSRLALVALLLLMGVNAAKAQTGRLELGQLDHLASKASQTVDVNIDERLVQLAAKIFSDKDPEDKEIKELIMGLKGVYVRSFEFEKDGEYVQADLESVRTQLRNPSWSKVLEVKNKKEENVEVYLMTGGEKLGGLAVLVSDATELTVINLIGTVDLEKLSKLEGQFGIPDLEIEKPKKKN